MATQSFKDLIVWQRASEFVVHIYGSIDKIRDFGFRDQLQRASISIANNIAEGHARKSDKSFRQFVLIAKGSAAEVESMLLLAARLGYLSLEKQSELLSEVDQISRLLSNFVSKLSVQDS